MRREFIIIGMDDSPTPHFTTEVMEAVAAGRVFSGGVRHRAIVSGLLPDGHVWIDIKAPLDDVFAQYEAFSGETITVFASGDPLFFGFANTVMRRIPEASIRLYPCFNSIQTLAHKTLTRYDDMIMVSLTGRPWTAFDNALIRRHPKIGVLTDHRHTPAAIAQRMLEYGYSQYEMIVGERLGNRSGERIRRMSLEEASAAECDSPNCILLVESGKLLTFGKDKRASLCSHSTATFNFQLSTFNSQFGIPDGQFELLDGRTRMITKAPIRLLTLQAMELPRRKEMWDIGFCTGSVSIEARLLFPHLNITAFEIRPECERLMHINSRRFGAPGIDARICDFMEADLSQCHPPDAVFIGGHGGKLKEMMHRIHSVLAPGGCVVFNSVTSESRATFEETAQELDMKLAPPERIALNDYNPITILKAESCD